MGRLIRVWLCGQAEVREAVVVLEQARTATVAGVPGEREGVGVLDAAPLRAEGQLAGAVLEVVVVDAERAGDVEAVPREGAEVGVLEGEQMRRC